MLLKVKEKSVLQNKVFNCGTNVFHHSSPIHMVKDMASDRIAGERTLLTECNNFRAPDENEHEKAHLSSSVNCSCGSKCITSLKLAAYVEI